MNKANTIIFVKNKNEANSLFIIKHRPEMDFFIDLSIYFASSIYVPKLGLLRLLKLALSNDFAYCSILKLAYATLK